ncbi:MAG: 23S rRNA (pseudouridine(1915)-N(3))-methyltransferase RlmH [Alphaproteobacteria bacterium]|nr:23S rRNA (pseudouridine(1915)-N(3))-methyltransferase RlmH [Alphaproteobacteria bacterium]
MRIVIAALGRARRGPIYDLASEYAKRLSWTVEVREVEPKKRLDGAALAAHEADLLRAQIPDGAVLVAMDERGRDLTSQDLAETLGRWQDDGRSVIGFVIGGAFGLDPALRADADLVLSFGRATWPHLLVRAMLMEQVYRAETILAGHPYHKP